MAAEQEVCDAPLSGHSARGSAVMIESLMVDEMPVCIVDIELRAGSTRSDGEADSSHRGWGQPSGFVQVAMVAAGSDALSSSPDS